MNFSIVVPKKKINKGKRPGMGSDFWKVFWEKKIDSSNRDYYSNLFAQRIKQIDTTVKKIKAESKNTEQLLYVEIKLDEMANSKSNSPTDVWNETGLEIVGAKDDKTLIVSGKTEDFERLIGIGSNGSFDSALNGQDLRRKKDKNLLRELYAMSAVVDRNAVIEGRVSNYIYSIIKNNVSNETVDCIIEIYSNINKNKYNSYYDILNADSIFKGKIKKRNIDLFFNNISFLASLTCNEITNILNDANYNFVSKIIEQPTLSSQRCIPEVSVNNINLLPSLTSEIIGLIDSGIYNKSLLSLRVQHHNYLNNQKQDEHHGTAVASRILFGDNFFTQLTSGKIAPTCNILDVQVLFLDNNISKCIPIDDLKGAILEVVKRYNNISIYNLSISENKPINTVDISELTEFLDNIARDYDVIFVCSVGNHEVYATHNYGDIFKQNESIISAPSDALNIISVGSISNNANNDCINSNKNFPSPFTRISENTKNIKKPELVASGGNIKKDPTLVYGETHMIASNNVFGVESMNKDGLNKDIGTSFSTPLITRECAFLLDFIKKAKASDYIDLEKNKFNLVKALLIHSTSKVKQAEILDDSIKRAYGFGIPDHSLVLKDAENEVTLMYADKINFIDKKHKLQIQLPESMLGKKAEFIFTLVYNPPVDKNYPQYKMVGIEPAIRFLVPVIDEDDEIKNKSKTISLNPKDSWDNYRNPNHNVIHFKKIRNKVGSSVLEVLLQLSVTQAYESKIVGKEKLENQSYAFILTVRDLSNLNNFRQDMLKINEFQELVQIETQEQVQI